MDNGTMPPSERATVRGRTARRSTYDRAVIDSILDEGVVCHVGFVQDEDPFVVPMSYARAGDKLYFHGGRGEKGGRVYNTAMAVMTLEVYYRYMPLYRQEAAEGEF